MDRNSILYKFRRKLQVVAHKLFSNETMSKIYYRIVLKKKLNLEDPQTFNEKLQWLKLYYYPNNETVVRCADKYAVRSYVALKGCADVLVPLLGAWDKAEDIQWEALPEKFVLKCNHGCAYNILCQNKEKLDKKSTAARLRKWLKEDFGAFNIEIHYSKIKFRKIICEEFLGECINDYKFFCFNGKPYCMYVSNDLVHDRQAQIGFFYLDGSKMPLKRDDYADLQTINLPHFFAEMKAHAEILAKDFPFVRVDFFVADGKYYFAELTFTPGGCMMPFNPDKYDLEWGGMLDIGKEMMEFKKE